MKVTISCKLSFVLPLKLTFEWGLPPVSISDLHMVVPTQVTPVQIHGGEVENDLKNQESMIIDSSGKRSHTSNAQRANHISVNSQGSSYQQIAFCMIIPFLLEWLIFSRCSACRPNIHWGSQERRSCHCCPGDYPHILFTETNTNTDLHVRPDVMSRRHFR